MLSNAMWFGITPETKNKGFQYGFITLSYEEAAIGFLTNFITFPFVFFIVFLFKYAKARRLRENRLLKALLEEDNEQKGDDNKHESDDEQENDNEEENDNEQNYDEQNDDEQNDDEQNDNEQNLNEQNYNEQNDNGQEEYNEQEENGENVDNLTADNTSQKIEISESRPSSNTSTISCNSNSSYLEDDEEEKFSLPYYCVYIGWLLCFLCILGSIFFLWAYGITFGNDRTHKWLTSMIISFFTNFVVFEPLKACLMFLKVILLFNHFIL